METVKSCPVCGSRKIFEYYRKYARCSECDLVFLYERMTDAETEEYYEEKYRYLLFGPTAVSDAEHVVAKRRAEIQVSELAKLMPVFHSFLDVGSGLGYLCAEVSKQLAPETIIGVEPFEKYREELNVCPEGNFVPYIEDVKGTFDAVALSHVLEHFNHPLAELIKIKKHMKDDGILMIEVPNRDCDINAFLPHHPMAFDWNSLWFLMDKAGFIPAAMAYHGFDTPIHRNILSFWRKTL